MQCIQNPNPSQKIRSFSWKFTCNLHGRLQLYVCMEWGPLSVSRQDKTRTSKCIQQNKARQDLTRQDNTRKQDKTRHKTRHDTTRTSSMSRRGCTSSLTYAELIELWGTEIEGTSEMDWDPPPRPLFSDHLYFIIYINYDWLKSNIYTFIL